MRFWIETSMCAAALLWGCALPASAQVAQLQPPEMLQKLPAIEVYSLASLEQIADQHNPILMRDRAVIESSRGAAIQAGLYPNPSFNSGNPFVFAGRQSLPNVGFQQEIPVMGKRRLDQAAVEETITQATELFQLNRMAMKTALRKQFYVALAAQARLRILDEILKALAELEKAGKEAQGKNKASDTDLAAIRLDYVRTVGLHRSAVVVLGRSRKQLAALAGIPNLPITELSGSLLGPYPQVDDNALLDYVANNSSQVRVGQSLIKQNEILLKRAQVDWIPNPTLGPAYQWGVNGQSSNNQFWFNLTFPVPVWNQNQGGIHAARSNVVSATESMHAIQNDMRVKALQMLGAYHQALEKVNQHEQEALPMARKAAAEARKAAGKDGRSLASHVDIHRTLTALESDFLDALTDMWNAAVDLAGILNRETFR